MGKKSAWQSRVKGKKKKEDMEEGQKRAEREKPLNSNLSRRKKVEIQACPV